MHRYIFRSRWIRSNLLPGFPHISHIGDHLLEFLTRIRLRALQHERKDCDVKLCERFRRLSPYVLSSVA